MNRIEVRNDSKGSLFTAEFMENVQMLQQDNASSVQETVDSQSAAPRRVLPSSFQGQVNTGNAAKRVHWGSMSGKGNGELTYWMC